MNYRVICFRKIQFLVRVVWANVNIINKVKIKLFLVWFYFALSLSLYGWKKGVTFRAATPLTHINHNTFNQMGFETVFLRVRKNCRDTAYNLYKTSQQRASV